MPVRKTKRGAERTPLEGSWDVVICGASFAGLTLARELTGSGARVLIVDRYDIGERQTSACGAPTEWLEAMGAAASIRQTFNELDFHTPYADTVMTLPWSFSTFDYRELCALLWEQCDAEFESAKVEGLAGERPAPGTPLADNHTFTIVTDRGEVSAPLVIDALGWRRVLGAGGYQPPEGPLSRGLEVHPGGKGERMELWIERDIVPAGYGWSFPAGDELGGGVGSFDPGFHVKEPTVDLAERLELPPDGYQGNWIPHRLREATEGGVFFCGDSAGHCLPLTAEGIRTAFYFSISVGRELRRVVDGRESGQGPASLRCLQRPPSLAVRVDAQGAEADPEGPAPAARGRSARPQQRALCQVVLRALSEHRVPLVRGRRWPAALPRQPLAAQPPPRP